MNKLISNEWMKLFSRKRVIVMVVLALLSGLVSIAVLKISDNQTHVSWQESYQEEIDFYNRQIASFPEFDAQEWENETSYRIFCLQDGLWYDMLFKDEEFVEKVISRYYELEKQYLNEEYMNSYIDSVIEYLGPAIDRNFEKWGHTFLPEWDDRLYNYQRNIHSYDEAVNQLKDYIKNRCEWMNENIDSLRQYSAESKVKNYNY